MLINKVIKMWIEYKKHTQYWMIDRVGWLSMKLHRVAIIDKKKKNTNHKVQVQVSVSNLIFKKNYNIFYIWQFKNKI